MFAGATTLAAAMTVSQVVTVHVQTASTVPHVVVMMALDEAAEIWRRSGVEFDWRFDDVESPVHVIIEDIRAPRDFGNKRIAWIIGRIAFETAETKPTIHLRFGLAKALLWHTKGSATVSGMTKIMQDRALALALGRTLAHEIGHCLLGPNSHTANGLMRPKWNPEELFSVRRYAMSVEIDETQKNRVALRLLQLGAHLVPGCVGCR